MEHIEFRRKRRMNRLYKLILPGGFVVIVILVAGGFFAWNLQKNDNGNVRGTSHPIITEENLQQETDMAENDAVEDGTDSILQETDTGVPWNLMLVNKWNAIPENYEINLVEVDGGEQVDERIYEPLMEMLEAAREGNWGELPMVVSGYRTQEKQQSLYEEKIRNYKKEGYSDTEAAEQAEQWVAIPGHSEHQVGLAVDINGATYDVYFWLQEHSYKYGFIFRYPGDKTNITGTAEEVWHYRYVGVEAATEMYEQGLCLEEYLEKIQSENQ